MDATVKAKPYQSLRVRRGRKIERLKLLLQQENARGKVAVRDLHKGKWNEAAQRRAEAEEIRRLATRTDLVCPICRTRPTRASVKTGLLLPCNSTCYRKRRAQREKWEKENLQ